MNASPTRACSGRSGLNGFTLVELVFVIALLTLAAVSIAKMQPSIYSTQVNSRDQYIGLELMRGCAERLLAARRSGGFGAVNNTLCNGLGGLRDFAANPTVVLKDATNTTLGAGIPCASSTCTATITIAKTAAPAASLGAITLQFNQ